MPEIPQDIQEIDKRIKAIKAQKKEIKNNSKDGYSQAAIVFQMAVELVSGVFVGAAIGYILDEMFDFKFICLLIFTIFGGIAGMVNVIRYLKKVDERTEGK